MLKKIITLIFAGLLTLTAFPACNAGEVDDSEGTLNIFMLEGGFGTDFMEEWIKAFNAIEGNEDIVVNYYYDVEASTKATNYLANPSENPYDLFLTGGIGFKAQAETGNLVDISDVYENFENPLREEFADMGKYNDKYYMVPWASGPCGLVYNTELLPDLLVPNTTDELIQLCKDIKAGNVETARDVAPLVWAGKNAGDYWQYVTDVWWAQYEGVENYYNFWSLNNNDPNGYTVYGQEGILKSYEVLQQLLNKSNGYSLHGSDTKEHTPAQTNFMQGQAVMIPVGDWLENEMKESYSDVTNYKLMKTPVISAIGKELELAGSGATDAQHDGKLSSIVEMVDGGKTVSEIAEETGIDESKITIVYEARNMITNIGANHQAYIPAQSNAIEEAKAFLTFMSSEEANRIFREYAHASQPYVYDTQYTAETPYMQSKDEISEECVFLTPMYDSSSIRYKAGLAKWNKISDVEKQLYNSTTTAQAFYEANYNFFTSAGENRWDYYYSRR